MGRIIREIKQSGVMITLWWTRIPFVGGGGGGNTLSHFMFGNSASDQHPIQGRSSNTPSVFMPLKSTMSTVCCASKDSACLFS